jgi:hypothetical protein
MPLHCLEFASLKNATSKNDVVPAFERGHDAVGG